MTTTPEQIDLWRQAPSEHQRLEFKEAKTQFDNHKLYEYCVALANEGGGRLLLGISDQPPRPVVGTKAFRDPVAMAEKLFQAVGFRVDIEEVVHPDGRVLVFQIPSRPRGTAYHLDGKYLMRAGEALVPMSEDHLRKIFAEGEPNWLEEHARTGLDDQEVVELLDSQTFFELLKLPYPSQRAGVIDRLSQERLIDVLDGRYALRRLGALLLAKRLEEFPDLARKAARVVVYTGPSKLETRLDQTGSRGYAVGFQGLVRFVMNQLPQNEIIEDALRKETKLVPEIVIRELVANALIHQDLTVVGASVMVEIFSNRLEISSPGEPMVPVERFIDGYQSRNERLADLMRRFHICEEKSSGIDRVVEAAEVYQLPAPDFRSGFRRTNVTLFGPRPFEEMDRQDRVRACYQHCCLRYVMGEKMSNQSLRERFRLSEERSESASRIIRDAMDARLVKLDNPETGSKRYARYVPFWA
ncbi:MAG: putative DNA binding domain-containing protein [Desulfobacteraceae bacterium]|nr:putative DNA binding domain-containing protein [Desulfobacteraceae bacterium]